MQIKTKIDISFTEEDIKKLMEAEIRKTYPTIDIKAINFIVRRKPSQTIEAEVDAKLSNEGDEPTEVVAEADTAVAEPQEVVVDTAGTTQVVDAPVVHEATEPTPVAAPTATEEPNLFAAAAQQEEAPLFGDAAVKEPEPEQAPVSTGNGLFG